MRNLRLLGVAVLAALNLYAQDVAVGQATASGVGVVLLTGKHLIDQIQITEIDGTNSTVRFYDSSGTNQFVATGIYTNATSYSTSWVTTTVLPDGYTNVITNVGIFTAYSAQPTNLVHRARLLTAVVPSSTTRTIDFNRQIVNGLMFMATNGSALVEVTYRKIQP